MSTKIDIKDVKYDYGKFIVKTKSSDGGGGGGTDPTIVTRIEALEALISEGDNPTLAIDKFNEILDFLDGYDNTDSLVDLLADKQDTISDLATIRSDASAGATAYQKPQGGIPDTDLSSAVQTSLGKADTALQQHQDISGKEDVTTIVAPVNATDAALPITSLTTEVGKYYRIDVPVETLVVTLPAMGIVTSVKTITVYLTGGTTPAVTITAADSKSVVLQDGYEIKSGKTYEINCLYNGAAWVVGALTINTGE